jgi:hypothetical protein
MARTVSDDPRLVRPGPAENPLTCAFRVERVTGIEPALSAWEAVSFGPVTWPDMRAGCPRVIVRDRLSPGLMAR